MTPEVERFVELATRPLEGRPEQCEEAKVELMSRISHQGVPLEMIDLSEPLGRLEKAKPVKPWPRRMVMLVAAIGLLISTLVMVGVVTKDVVLTIQAEMMPFRYGPMGSAPPIDSTMLTRWIEREAPGMPIKNGSDDELERAIEREPGDSALFQQKLLRKLGDRSGAWTGLSEEEREVADRIDPGNGFYDFIEIRAHFERATGGRLYSSRGKAKIADETAFLAGIEAFARAGEAEVIHDASGELKRRQIEALPRAEELMEEVIAEPLSDHLLSATGYRYYYSSNLDLVGVHVDRLVASKDSDGLRKLSEQARNISRRLAEDSEKGGIDPQVAASWINSTLTAIKMGMTDLDLHDEARELGKITYAVDGGSTGFNLRGQAWRGASSSLRMGDWADAPADLTLEEVIPAGRTERAAIQRFIALSGALITLLMILFVVIECYRRPRRVAGMSNGLIPLLNWRDRLWIAGLGLALPWAWFLGITCLTPMGIRDLSIEAEDGIAILILLIQSSATLIFAVVMLVWVGYWRWEKRGGFLAFHGGWVRLGLISGILAGLTVPAVGLYRYLSFANDDEKVFFFLGVCGLAVIGLLWLIWITILNVFTPKANALRANVVMRTILPWMLTGLASLLICAGVQWSAERYWMKRDTLFPSWTSETHKNALEERVARDVREQILELLDQD